MEYQDFVIKVFDEVKSRSSDTSSLKDSTSSTPAPLLKATTDLSATTNRGYPMFRRPEDLTTKQLKRRVSSREMLFGPSNGISLAAAAATAEDLGSGDPQFNAISGQHAVSAAIKKLERSPSLELLSSSLSQDSGGEVNVKESLSIDVRA